VLVFEKTPQKKNNISKDTQLPLNFLRENKKKKKKSTKHWGEGPQWGGGGCKLGVLGGGGGGGGGGGREDCLWGEGGLGLVGEV